MITEIKDLKELSKSQVIYFIDNENILYVDNAYLNDNVLHLHKDIHLMLGDRDYEEADFNITDWCYENLNIIHYDNSIGFDEFIINTEKSDTFAYHKTKL